MLRNWSGRSRGVLTLLSLLAMAAVPGVSKADFDFNRDGYSDLLFQNRATGDVYDTLMNGTTGISGDFMIRGEDTNWKIVAAPDINGDGEADLVWQNEATGDVWYSILDGVNLSAGDYLIRGMDLDWKIVGSADLFNNNGIDILWQNQRSGDVYYSPLNGAVLENGDYIFQGVDTHQKIRAVTSTGDPNNPGIELIWQDDANGDISYTDLNGTRMTDSAYLRQGEDPAWVVAGTSVLSGIGHTDLILQNTNTGDVYGSPLMGTYLEAGGYLFNGIDTNWKLVGLNSQSYATRVGRAPRK